MQVPGGLAPTGSAGTQILGNAAYLIQQGVEADHGIITGARASPQTVSAVSFCSESQNRSLSRLCAAFFFPYFYYFLLRFYVIISCISSASSLRFPCAYSSRLITSGCRNAIYITSTQSSPSPCASYLILLLFPLFFVLLPSTACSIVNLRFVMFWSSTNATCSYILLIFAVISAFSHFTCYQKAGNLLYLHLNIHEMFMVCDERGSIH